MRTITITVLLSILMPGAALAQDKCGNLQLFDTVQMIRADGGVRYLVPVSINGTKKNFVFDTGGSLTQIAPSVVEELNLSKTQSNIQMYDAQGNISRSRVRVHQFLISHTLGTDIDFQVLPGNSVDGLVALDHLMRLDVDVDFGTDKLNLFSPDHCPGAVLYWKAPAVAQLPITMDGYHVIVPVMLDGQVEKALIDTGAPNTLLTIDEAKRAFNLTPGADDTPQAGNLFGDASLKIYRHQFKSLKFGDITVDNPVIGLIPNAFGRNADKAQLVGDRTKSEKDLLSIQTLTIGMDVLRKLHVYMSFGERRMYITEASAPVAVAVSAPASSPTPDAAPASPSPAQTQRTVVTREQMASMPAADLQAAYKKYMQQRIPSMEQRLAVDANDINALADLCAGRAAIKTDLDAALGECDKALAREPAAFRLLDTRAFVLYQQGKYQDALTAYDKAVSANPKYAPSLFMRGHTKGKLGDAAGHDADIAAAKSSNPNIEIAFKPYDIDY